VLNELEELEHEGFHVQTALSSTQPVFTSFTPCHQIPIIDGSEHPKSGERLADIRATSTEEGERKYSPRQSQAKISEALIFP